MENLEPEIEPTYLVIRTDDISLHWLATHDQLPDILGIHECIVQKLGTCYGNEAIPTTVYTFNEEEYVNWTKSEEFAKQHGTNVRKWVYDCHAWAEEMI